MICLFGSCLKPEQNALQARLSEDIDPTALASFCDERAGAVGIVVSSAKQALAKAHELAEAGNEVFNKDLAGKIIDTAIITDLAANESGA